MNESAMTRTLLAKARQAEPDAFVWKITEKILGGKPDALYIGKHRKTWLEFKKCTSVKDPDPVSQLTQLQRLTLEHLARLGQDVLVVGYVGAWRSVEVYRVQPDGTYVHLEQYGRSAVAKPPHPLLAYLGGSDCLYEAGWPISA